MIERECWKIVVRAMCRFHLGVHGVLAVLHADLCAYEILTSHWPQHPPYDMLVRRMGYDLMHRILDREVLAIR